MNIFLAINEKNLERFISSLKDCNVIKSRRDNKNLVKEVIDYNPHILIISNAIIQKENNSTIISELRKEQPQTRIIFLYGQDDCSRKMFTNFLIEQKVYDFHVGSIDEEVITTLLRDAKSINDVQLEEVTTEERNQLIVVEKEKTKKLEAIYNQKKKEVKEKINRKTELLVKEESNIEKREQIVRQLKKEEEEEIQKEVEKEVEKEILIKEVKKLEVRIIERVEEYEREKIIEKEVIKTKILEQKTLTIMSLTSQTYKDFVVSNIATILSENNNVLVIDLDTPFPTLDHHFNVKKDLLLEDSYSNRRVTGVSGGLSANKRNVLNKNSFKNFVVKTKIPNLDLMTGLFDIEVFDSTEEDEIEDLISIAKLNYEIVIISVNQFIANSFTYKSLEMTDNVLLVSEDTYINARENISFIKEMVINQNEDKSKFKIISFGESYLEKDTVLKLYEGYNYLGILNVNLKHHYNMLNQKKLGLDEKEKEQYIKMFSKLGFEFKKNKKGIFNIFKKRG